jgi:Xaa-Pro dipeptidase
MPEQALEKNSPEERGRAFFELLDQKEKNVETAIISDQKHIFYFTGFSTWKPRHSSFLILRRNGEPTLFLGSSASEKAEESFHGKIATFEDYNPDQRMIAYVDFVSQKLREFVQNEKILEGKASLAFEGWQLPEDYLEVFRKEANESVRFVDVSELILQMRKTKGEDELDFERESTKRLSEAYRVIKKHAESGATELDLYAEANRAVFRKFDPLEYFEVSNVFGDFVSGSRTVQGGGGPTKKKMKDGDLLILDLQASYMRHWTDTCRTYVVGYQKPSVKQMAVFNVIIKAKKNAESLLKPGTKARDVFKIVSDTIVSAGYHPLHHHAGHGLGLDDQEAPFFLPNSSEIIEEGDVCAVEPGIYEKSFGGMRIEDNYVITKDGFEKISKFPLGFP